MGIRADCSHAPFQPDNTDGVGRYLGEIVVMMNYENLKTLDVELMRSCHWSPDLRLLRHELRPALGQALVHSARGEVGQEVAPPGGGHLGR